LLLLLLIIFLPAFGIIIASGLSQRENEVVKAQNSALLLAQSLAAQQEKVTAATKTMLGVLARLPILQNLDAGACNELFRELHDQYPFYSVILATTPDGEVFAASTPFKAGSINLSDRKHIRDVISTRDFSVGEYIKGRVSNMLSLNFTYPVLNARKKLIAIVIAGFNLNEYARFVSKVNLPDGYVVTITDWKGVRLFRLPAHDATGPGRPLPREAFTLISGTRDQGFFSGVSEDGVNRVYAFRQLHLAEDLPPYLYMLVGIPRDSILHNANARMFRDLSILGIAAVIAMALAWMFGNIVFVRPLNRLVVAAHRFGKGEMAARTGLPHTSDELGLLAGSFDDMALLVEMKSIERENAERRQELANKILEILNSPGEIADLLHHIPPLLRSGAGIEAVGIRLRVGQNFPYIESEGFPEHFLEAGKLLCVSDEGGDAIGGAGYGRNECLCSIVINRRTDPSLPFFTEAGSFWTNSMSTLITSVSQEELRGPAKGPCLSEGYESVALVPLKSGDEVVGLLQLNDRLADRFDQAHIEFFEGIATSIGITLSRKRAEEEVAAREQKYRNIFERAFEGIFQISVDGKFISANPSLARMHGYLSPEDMLAHITDMSAQLYVSSGDRAKFLAILKEKGSIERDETQMYRKDGSIIWVSLSIRAVRNSAGRTLYYEGMVEDVTDRKIAELSLRTALKELESEHRELEAAWKELRESQKKIIQQEKMASIGQLAAGVAHEINNPMGFIMSNLNSLKKYMMKIPEFIRIQSEAIGELSQANGSGETVRHRTAEAGRSLKIDYILEDAQSLIKESLDGAERVKVIVQDLKNFSRVDEAEYKLADINRILESTFNIVWNELKYKATVKKEYGRVSSVWCNAGQLGQVFMNILVNAAQAMPDHGEITIRSWEESASVHVAVSDTGSGIPESQLSRIFEPFFTTKEVGKGTGLGLSIAYDIVKKHKGEIEVLSEAGKGTTFIVRIPIGSN
jgi:PAS domain S-box-containing protein